MGKRMLKVRPKVANAIDTTGTFLPQPAWTCGVRLKEVGFFVCAAYACTCLRQHCHSLAMHPRGAAPHRLQPPGLACPAVSMHLPVPGSVDRRAIAQPSPWIKPEVA